MNVQEIIAMMERRTELWSSFNLTYEETAALLAHIRSRESIIEQQKNTIHALTMGLPDHLPKTSTELAKYIGNLESELAALKRPVEGEDKFRSVMTDHALRIALSDGSADGSAKVLIDLYRSALRDANRWADVRSRARYVDTDGGAMGYSGDYVVRYPARSMTPFAQRRKEAFDHKTFEAAVDSAMEKSNG